VAHGLKGHELWLALVVVVCDQASKALVRARFQLGESITVIRGLFDIARVHNTGTAFGFMNGIDFPFKAAVLAAVALVALGGLTLYLVTLPADQRLARTGLAMILGGALGNLVDRVALGYVTDFVDLYWANWHFWAFNVADAAITVGVAIILLEMLGVGTTGGHEATEPPPA
jgi:signal peptidase II